MDEWIMALHRGLHDPIPHSCTLGSPSISETVRRLRRKTTACRLAIMEWYRIYIYICCIYIYYSYIYICIHMYWIYEKILALGCEPFTCKISRTSMELLIWVSWSTWCTWCSDRGQVAEKPRNFSCSISSNAEEFNDAEAWCGIEWNLWYVKFLYSELSWNSANLNSSLVLCPHRVRLGHTHWLATFCFLLPTIFATFSLIIRRFPLCSWEFVQNMSRFAFPLCHCPIWNIY
jgi:hypothetical protein